MDLPDQNYYTKDVIEIDLVVLNSGSFIAMVHIKLIFYLFVDQVRIFALNTPHKNRLAKLSVNFVRMKFGQACESFLHDELRKFMTF